LRAVAKRALLSLAALFIAVSAGNGCAPATRYQVLSFFFDGVPKPEETGAKAKTGSGGKTPSKKKIVVSKHAPYANKQCGGCHSYSTNSMVAPIPKLCYGCHKMGQQEKRYFHAPAVAGACRTCHEPHSSPNPFLLLKPPRQMCLFCHNPEDVAKNKVHKDDQAPCTECHDVHADARFFLRAAVPELCYGCHQMGQKVKRYIHAPVVAGACRTCHESHNSPNPFLLLKEPRQMCLFCHNPEDVAKNKVHTDDQAPCTQCHDVHADIRFFLRGDSAGTTPPAKSDPASAQ